MLDVAFSELLLVLVIGLLVLGPERLPAAVRTVSLWVGRLRRSFASIRDEFEREIGADEIKRQLHNESIMKTFKDVEDGLSRDFNSGRDQLKSLEYDISDIVDDKRPQDSNNSNSPRKPSEPSE